MPQGPRRVVHHAARLTNHLIVVEITDHPTQEVQIQRKAVQEFG